HLARRPPPEEPALEEVLLPVDAGRGDLRAAPACPFVREQGLEHADRRVERRPRRPVGGLAVPAAVGQLFGEQPVDDATDVLAEVGAGRGHLPVDARLHLAGEEAIAVTLRRPTALPRHAVADEAHRAACLFARGVETEVTQQHQDVHRGVPPAVPRRAAPLPVRRLEGEQPRAGPSVATRARSPATSSSGAPVRSRITCQRTDGSASSSQSTTVTDRPPVRQDSPANIMAPPFVRDGSPRGIGAVLPSPCFMIEGRVSSSKSPPPAESCNATTELEHLEPVDTLLVWAAE